MGGRADEGVGQRGLKHVCIFLPISLSCAKSACLIGVRMCRVLGSAVESRWNPTLEYPYNPKGALTHLPRLSVSVRGAEKGIFFIPSVSWIRIGCLDLFREGQFIVKNN